MWFLVIPKWWESAVSNKCRNWAWTCFCRCLAFFRSASTRVRDSWGTVTPRNRKTTLRMAASTTSTNVYDENSQHLRPTGVPVRPVLFWSIAVGESRHATALGLDIREIRRKISCKIHITRWLLAERLFSATLVDSVTNIKLVTSNLFMLNHSVVDRMTSHHTSFEQRIIKKRSKSDWSTKTPVEQIIFSMSYPNFLQEDVNITLIRTKFCGKKHNYFK